MKNCADAHTYRRRRTPGATQEEVYNRLENEYYDAIGRRRYTNFKSFRAKLYNKNPKP